MLAKKIRLTLETRKQALLVDSELNRAHLLNEWQEARNQIHQMAARAQTVGSVASSAAKLAAAAVGVYRGFSRRLEHAEKPAENKKSSWVSAAFKGARAGFSILSALRPR